jgi:hypothetical protein
LTCVGSCPKGGAVTPLAWIYLAGCCAFLEGEFSRVTLHRHEVTLALPSAQPVIRYLNSVREPIERHVGEPLSFDALLDGISARIEQVIRVQGCFRAASRSGVFVCR